MTPKALRDAKARFRRFAADRVAPHAKTADRDGRLAPEVIAALRSRGFLGAPLPREVGGGGMDLVSYGLLTAEIGRACSAARTLLTVHDLVTLTLKRWGGPAVRAEVLPDLASGVRIAAIALSEPAAGSDIHAIWTTLRPDGAGFRLDGVKSWVSFGTLANWLLVFARSDRGDVAVLVPGDAPGLTRRPVTDVTGLRGSGMAELTFENCRVTADRVVGRPGFGLSHVAATALDHGRYSVACGAVGVADACLAAAFGHLSNRRQFGARMADLPLARAALGRMAVEARAARRLCLSAGALRQAGDPEALLETLMAKRFASSVAVRAANAAVRLCGARGLSGAYDAERLLRDAKALEIIEGAPEVLDLTIGAQLTVETVDG